MDEINFFPDNLDVQNQKVILRLDLNVPLIDDKITDTTRINKIIPTLKFLISQNTKIIIISHVGRPKGEVVNELSLRPICKDLEMKLRQNIKLISKDIKEIVSKDLFDIDNVELNFRDEALVEIAKKAIKRKAGARGLRSIMEELLMETMFELPDDNLEKVIIDENTVISNSDPIKLLKSKKKKSSSAN